MSPVSPSQVSEPAAARVQAPFTLSDTWTCSGALYWLNHPTSRSPCATARVSVTVNAETRDPVENAVPCTKVGPATAGCGNRTPRVEIRTRTAAQRASGKCFTQTPSFCTCDIGGSSRSNQAGASSDPGNDQSRGALGSFQ